MYVAFILHTLFKAVSAFEMKMVKEMPTREQVLEIVRTMDKIIKNCGLISEFEAKINRIWSGRLELKIVHDMIKTWL